MCAFRTGQFLAAMASPSVRLAAAAVAIVLLLGAEAFSGARGFVPGRVGAAKRAAASTAASKPVLGLRMQGGGATNWLAGYKPEKEQFLDWRSPPAVSELPEMTQQIYEDVGIIKVGHGGVSRGGVRACGQGTASFRRGGGAGGTARGAGRSLREAVWRLIVRAWLRP